MNDIITVVLGIGIAYIGVKALWVSTNILTERSILRKVTGAYYDFEITEALEEMNLTRQEAINKWNNKK
jgi:hypothetical protein|tara:strand:- start:482 stop:688 length:207 start_codon:yes stop_codon:yes gene_type:complete